MIGGNSQAFSPPPPHRIFSPAKFEIRKIGEKSPRLATLVQQTLSNSSQSNFETLETANSSPPGTASDESNLFLHPRRQPSRQDIDANFLALANKTQVPGFRLRRSVLSSQVFRPRRSIGSL